MDLRKADVEEKKARTELWKALGKLAGALALLAAAATAYLDAKATGAKGIEAAATEKATSEKSYTQMVEVFEQQQHDIDRNHEMLKLIITTLTEKASASAPATAPQALNHPQPTAMQHFAPLFQDAPLMSAPPPPPSPSEEPQRTKLKKKRSRPAKSAVKAAKQVILEAD